MSTLLVLLLTIGSVIVRRGYSFSVQQPTFRLAEMPRSLGDWAIEMAAMSEGERQVLGADDSLSWKLTDPAGQVAFLHIATWADEVEIAETCPHHPAVCYRGNGFTAIETKNDEISLPNGDPVPVEMSVMKRGQETVSIGFTYQMGKQRFATDGEARFAQAQLWGQKQWPPVTKFLVQVNSDRLQRAAPEIESLLKASIAWYSDQSERQSQVSGGNG